MTYKISTGTARTVKEFSNAKDAAASDREAEEAAHLRLFGFTEAEARNQLGRYITTASDLEIEDLWNAAPYAAYARALEIAQTLEPVKGSDLVSDALDGAKTPKDFWRRLEATITKEEKGNE